MLLWVDLRGSPQAKPMQPKMNLEASLEGSKQHPKQLRPFYRWNLSQFARQNWVSFLAELTANFVASVRVLAKLSVRLS